MPTTSLPFGTLLKQLRKRAGLTQRDLAAALGYSKSLVSALEKDQRLPDLDMVMQRYLPALGLQAAPHLAAQLVEAAVQARGESLPTTWTIQHTHQIVIQDDLSAESCHLPTSPTQLIGREPEIKQLSQRLLGHPGRLLTLVGPPGIGKTRLALAVAERVQPRYADGVCFVPLATVNAAEAMATALLAAVGGHEASPKPLPAQLIALLRRKTLLLVQITADTAAFFFLHQPRSSKEKSTKKNAASLWGLVGDFHRLWGTLAWCLMKTVCGICML